MNSTPANPAMLLTPRQAAKSLAISQRKLWSMTHSGEIPHVRLGRCVRYPFDELQQWIASQSKGGAAFLEEKRQVALPVFQNEL